MSAPSIIRPATRDELPALARLMARSFADDPVHRRLTVPSSDLEHRATAWFDAEIRVHFDHGGEVWVDDGCRGVAIWTGPDRYRPPLLRSLAGVWPSLRYYRGRSLRGLRLVSAMERIHPTDRPHRYLAYLATDPDQQGHGVGTALITAGLDHADRLGVGAYLESSKDENLSWYARFGFEADQPVGVAGGPQLTPMWRDAREPT